MSETTSEATLVTTQSKTAGRTAAKGATKTFRLILVKPSHYDDDGYVIQWLRSAIPSNTLAQLYGLARRCNTDKILGADVEMEIEAYDETNRVLKIKKMIRSLRNNRAVWYAPDQSYNRKGAEVVPFFGIPCMHTTATSTLARLGDAVTIPYFPERLPDGRYRLRVLPPLENFPSDDLVADTMQYVRALEDQVRRCPEQYFWVHRKFKDLPPDYPDYYADLDASK